MILARSLRAFGTNKFKDEFESEIEENAALLPYGCRAILDEDYHFSVEPDDPQEKSDSIEVVFRVRFESLQESGCGEKPRIDPDSRVFIASISKVDGATKVRLYDPTV